MTDSDTDSIDATTDNPSETPRELVASNSETQACVAFSQSDDAAVARAQSSIDRWLTDSSNGDSDFCSVALEDLSAALDMLGSLGVGPLATQSADDRPILLGRFQVFGERGRGGFGIVLRAFDPLLQRDVALKLPRPERLMAGQSPDDFVREAQLAARLEHPGIVRVYEARRLGPVWYIASAYCAGPTLAEWIDGRESPLQPKVAARLLAEVADAVHYAHSRAVLHLDLKPENILLVASDSDSDLMHPLVTDFGLAGRCDGTVTSTSRIAGTIAYMAPEQRTGDSSRIGIASDVYALGVILHELLNGPRRRQQATSGDETTSTFSVEVPPLSAVRATTPRDLNSICQKCLCNEPQSRYGSAQELAADLRSYLRGEAVSVRTADWPEVLSRWVRRRPAVAALVVLLAVTAISSLGTITHLWQRAEANLAQLRLEEKIHAQTSDRMRSSLLNLTWLAQEKRLQQGRPDARNVAELQLLRDFYRDLRGWSRTGADKQTLDAALLAASHSLALIDGLTPLAQSRVDEEFTAGVAAWQGVIAHRPTESHWHRALALHFFTYAARSQPPQWLWWQNADNQDVPIPPAVLTIVEEPYALLLCEFAGQHARFRSPASTYDMLSSAVSLLERRRNLPDPGGARLRMLLAAYNQMAEAARLLSRTDQSRYALGQAEALAQTAPPAVECPPELALVVGDTHDIRSRILAREGDVRSALTSLEKATPYLERAVDEFADDAATRLLLVKLLQRAAVLHSRLEEDESATARYRRAISVLDSGIALVPGHRNLTQRRATVKFALARFQLAAGDGREAQASLEGAVKDYADIGLCNHDSTSIWMRSIRCWQVLGRLYTEENRRSDAAAAYEKSLALLEEVRPRRGHSPQFAEYSGLSRNALAKLALQRGKGSVQ